MNRPSNLLGVGRMLQKCFCAVTIICAVLYSVSDTALADTKGRYTFKGITLGMSMSSFRHTDFPDKGLVIHDVMRMPTKPPRTYRTNCRESMWGDGLTDCWFEASSEEYTLTCKMDIDGIIAHLRMSHKLASRYESNPEPFTIRGAHQWINKECFRRVDVGFGGKPPSFNSNITYMFHNKRLLQITIEIGRNEAPSLIPKLIAKYGKPTSDTKPIMQNAFRATFENRVVRWDNGQDEILVKRYDDDLRSGHFSYTHLPTWNQYQAYNKRQTEKNAKDF